MSQCQSAYLKSGLDNKCVKLVVKTMIRLIKESNWEFDTIAFRGVSGALVAPIIAYEMGKELIVVRKIDKDPNHSGRKAEGNAASHKYIIIDDMVCSGETIRQTYDAAQELAPKAKCVAIFLYCDSIDAALKVKPDVHVPTFSFRINSDTAKLMSYRRNDV